MAKKNDEKMVSLRAAVLLLIAVVIGGLAGALSYLSEPNLPTAILYAGGAFVGTVIFLDKVVE